MRLWRREEENKYNRFIREKIREAREESGMTQADLGEAISKSSVAISDLERGRTEVNAVDLMGIAVALKKPITFFYPNFIVVRGAKSDELTDKEKELINFFREI